MENENWRDSIELDVGSMVRFKKRNIQGLFQGSVYYFTRHANGSLFGIQNVTLWRPDGTCDRVGEAGQFNLNDITEMQVNVVAWEPPNTQDGNNNNRDDGSSSSSIDNKMESLRLDPPSE